MSDIHSCSLYCDRPACIKQQRDELRDKPWVGLTDAERRECTQFPFSEMNHRAIEAKLKEKNT